MHTLSDIHLQFATAFRDPRIRPAAYLLSKKLQEGHTCVPVDNILSEELPFEQRWLPDPVNLPELVGTPDSTPKPFIRDGHLLYFQRYHYYESQIIRHVVARASSSLQLLQERMANLEKHQSLIASLSATYPLDGLLPEEQCDWQLVACLQALLSDFSIITGGPGTGKTTTLAKLLRIIYAINLPLLWHWLRLQERLPCGCMNHSGNLQLLSLKCRSCSTSLNRPPYIRCWATNRVPSTSNTTVKTPCPLTGL